MKLDLDQLGQMHPRLQQASLAESYRRHAAMALARAAHVSGVHSQVVEGSTTTRATLHWTALPTDAEALGLIDAKRVTEDGAEAVALAVVHTTGGWTVKRRMQQGEHGDWLLVGPQHTLLNLVLEVSGTEESNAAQRLGQKLSQVAKSTEPNCDCAAVVVSFKEPTIYTQTLRRRTTT